MSRTKFLILTTGTLAFIYFLLLPTLWPKPKITLSIPSSYQTNKKIEATVTIHSWHSNFALFAVDGIFQVNPGKNNGNSVIALNLLPKRDNKTWDADHTLGINRWTWPRTYTYKITLPLRELHIKDIIESDHITGRIRVELRYADVNSQGFTMTLMATHIEKFNISINNFNFYAI